MASRSLPIIFRYYFKIRLNKRGLDCHSHIWFQNRNWLSSSSQDNDDTTSGKNLSSILKGMAVVTNEGRKSEIGQKIINSAEQSDNSSSSSESSGESSSDSSDDEEEIIKKSPKLNISPVDQKEVVLSSLAISDKSHQQLLELAKPKQKRKDISSNNVAIVEKQTSETDLDHSLVSAVKEVAASLQKEPDQIESELLQKLKSHSVESGNNDIGIETGTQFSHLLVGMEVDRTGKRKRIGQISRNREEKFAVFQKPFETILNTEDDLRPPSPRLDKKTITRIPEEIKKILFSGPRLNIFNSENFQDRVSLLPMWNKLEALELKQLSTQPFSNGFEEMIHWTEHNKLWHFPINNEQGLEEEAKIGFHEHVFLDHHLEDGFPKKGPIRHFMDLVCIGLSKNPYLSIQGKKDHIDWYRQYFKDKEKYLIETKN